LIHTQTAPRGQLQSIAPRGTENWGSESAFAEEHWRVKKLAELWATSRETLRLLVKDEPGVLKIRQGRRQANATYSIPSSVAQRVHARLSGDDSAFNQKHYRIADLGSHWALGRETVRLLVKSEPGVLKFRQGKKKAHATYSVPESVAKRIHLRLAN
jgi:hypothetical protein